MSLVDIVVQVQRGLDEVTCVVAVGAFCDSSAETYALATTWQDGQPQQDGHAVVVRDRLVGRNPIGNHDAQTGMTLVIARDYSQVLEVRVLIRRFSYSKGLFWLDPVLPSRFDQIARDVADNVLQQYGKVSHS